MGRNASHAGILDAQFLPQERIVFPVLIPFGSESDSSFRAVSRPTTSIDGGILGE